MALPRVALLVGLIAALVHGGPGAESFAGPISVSPFAPGKSGELGALETWSADDAAVANTVEEEVKGDAAEIRRQIAEEVRRGSFVSLAKYGKSLVSLQPQEYRIRTFYALYCAAAGQIALARAEIAAVRQAQPKVEPLIDCAESMILRSEGKATESLRAARSATEALPDHPFPWNVLGRALLGVGDPTNALGGFEKALALQPDFAPAYNNAASVLLTLNQPDRALDLLEKAKRLRPSDFRIHYGLAVALETLGRFEEAVSSAAQSTVLHPTDPSLRRYLGELQIKSGRFAEAAATGNRLLKEGVAAGGLLVADAALRMGNAEEAIRALNGAPMQEAGWNYLLGLSFLAKDQYVDAGRQMEAVLRLDADHFGARYAVAALRLREGRVSEVAWAATNRWDASLSKLFHYARASVVLAQGDLATARSEFLAADGFFPGFSVEGISAEQLRKSFPRESMGTALLGVLFLLRDQSDQALRILQPGSPAFRASALAQYWAAAAYLKKGDREAATVTLNEVLRQIPTFHAAQVTLAEVLFQSGKPELAAPHWRAAQDVKPTSGIALRLGVFHENRKEFELAEKYYRDLIRSSPDWFVGYNQLAWMLTRDSSRLEEALSLARKANALQPGNAGIQDTLGWILHLRGQGREAIGYLEGATRANPLQPVHWYHLGVACLTAKQVEQGRAALQKALEISPNFEEADDARRLIESTSRR